MNLVSKIWTDNLPAELKELKQWVAWKAVFNPEKEKYDKRPVNPSNGLYAKTNDRNTWGTFEDAVNRVKQDNLAGIGFVFSKDDPYIGIDIDGCVDINKQLSDVAREIVIVLNSYSEFSPSGNGVHIIVKGDLPEGGKKNVSLGIEMYSDGRFFTFTGNLLPGSPLAVEQRSEQIASLHSRHMAKPSAKQVLQLPTNGVYGDQELITKAMAAADGAKFQRLWNGDASDYGGDHSSADLALCCKLAFWTGKDEARIDTLFRLSGLFRKEKWDKQHFSDGRTYGQATITQAIASTQDCYTPPGQRKKKQTTVRLDEVSEDNEFESKEKLTDLGNSARLVRLFGNKLRYCYSFGRWLVWDGQLWIIDENGKIMEFAEKTVRSIYKEAAKAEDRDQRRALMEHARKSEGLARRKAFIEGAQHKLATLVDSLDADPWVLNVENGTIDLRTGELLPHDPSRLITKLAPVKYDTQATCPRFIQFLNEVFPAGESPASGGNKNLIQFIQRLLGYSLTGITSEQKMAICWGSGANGKSTLLNLFLEMLGNYAETTPTDTFLARRDGGIPNDIARLRGARMVLASEAQEGRRLNEPLVKSVTGGDKLTARFLRCEFFTFTPSFKLYVLTNFKPLARGDDPALWRRIMLLPFTQRFEGARRDNKLREKLLAELPGILKWCVDGCLAWQREGLSAPAEVLQATAEYQNENDLLTNWIEECCVTGQYHTGRTSDLYASFQSWISETGEKMPVSRKSFSKKLQEKGYECFRGAGNAHTFRGLGLISNRDEEEPEKSRAWPF